MKFYLLIALISFSNILFCFPFTEKEFILICTLSFKTKKELVQNQITPWHVEEGLCAGTLVKIPHGYTTIEDLNEQDLIVSYDKESNYYEQPILAISKHQITTYIRLTISNQIIHAAPDQKFYVVEKEQWIKAEDLVLSNIILQAHGVYQLVHQIEKVQEPTFVYFLKVADYRFCITSQDIFVHNSDVLTVSAQMLSIGAIVLNNPILATIGSAIKLVDLGMQIYEIVNDQINTLALEQAHAHGNKNLPERIYYEKRKNDLLKLKQEFLDIRQGLYRIVAGQQISLMQCTNTFLQHIEIIDANIAIGITPSQESQLNEVQRQELTAFRQQELDQLEQEIKDLQVTLAAHFNELIIRRNQAYEEANVLFVESQKLIDPWNKCFGNVIPHAAIEYYERELKTEYLLQDLDLRNKELKFAIGYYKNANNASIFKNTTNIVTVIAQEENQAHQIDNYIQESRKTNITWKKITEDYFGKHKINANNIQFNVQNNIKSIRATKKSHADQEALERLILLKQNNNHKKPKQEKKSLQVSAAGGKPPDDDDPRNNKPSKKEPVDKNNDKKKHSYGKFKYDATYHHQNSKGGEGKGAKSPAPKNGQKALDNSVQIKTTAPRRIGISDGEIVILDRTSEKPELLFHGHVQQWDQLDDKLQTLLERAIKNGEITGPIPI